MFSYWWFFKNWLQQKSRTWNTPGTAKKVEGSKAKKKIMRAGRGSGAVSQDKHFWGSDFKADV